MRERIDQRSDLHKCRRGALEAIATDPANRSPLETVRLPLGEHEAHFKGIFQVDGWELGCGGADEQKVPRRERSAEVGVGRALDGHERMFPSRAERTTPALASSTHYIQQ
jgi:hypothetical protein